MPSPAVLTCLIAEALVCAFAFIAGGWRERTGAAIILLTVALNFALRAIWPGPDTAWRYFIADGLCLVVMFCLCWKSPHPWPLWATAFQLLAVSAEINAFFSLTILNLRIFSLYTALYIAAYGVLLALLVGTFAARRAKRIKMG